MNMFTNLICKRGRAIGPKRPRFGTHDYIGAHRYVYYINGRPKYYFSDRPYTIKDAKSWKSRGIITSVIILIILLSVLFEFKLTEFGSAMVPVFLLDVFCVGFVIFRLIGFLLFQPKDDPMLESFQCPEDHKKPREDTCKHCGGIFPRGAHTVCPHCNAQIEDKN